MEGVYTKLQSVYQWSNITVNDNSAKNEISFKVTTYEMIS